jgi:hypothetical protein
MNVPSLRKAVAARLPETEEFETLPEELKDPLTS